jgi:hypothetical protein
VWDRKVFASRDYKFQSIDIMHSQCCLNRRVIWRTSRWVDLDFVDLYDFFTALHTS